MAHRGWGYTVNTIDLVEKLRGRNETHRDLDDLFDTCVEAADEIERLRDALAEIGDYHDDGGTASVWTQDRVGHVLGDDWWEVRWGEEPSIAAAGGTP